MCRSLVCFQRFVVAPGFDQCQMIRAAALLQYLIALVAGFLPAGIGDLPQGCSFAPRCGFSTAQCAAAQPGMVALGDGHLVRCIRPEAWSAAL